MNEGMDEGSTGLREFRERLYRCFPRRAGTLFEFCEAILTAGSVPAPVHLSVASVRRRGWCNLYAALSKGRIEAEVVRELLSEPILRLFFRKAPANLRRRHQCLAAL